MSGIGTVPDRWLKLLKNYSRNITLVVVVSRRVERGKGFRVNLGASAAGQREDPP